MLEDAFKKIDELITYHKDATLSVSLVELREILRALEGEGTKTFNHKSAREYLLMEIKRMDERKDNLESPSKYETVQLLLNFLEALTGENLPDQAAKPKEGKFPFTPNWNELESLRESYNEAIEEINRLRTDHPDTIWRRKVMERARTIHWNLGSIEDFVKDIAEGREI